MKELLALKHENEKLKEGMCEVERLMFENKIMKLELQRIKPASQGSGDNMESEFVSTDNTSK